MDIADPPQQVSLISYLIRTGIQHQLLVISLGVVLSIIALFILFITRNRSQAAVVSICSILPGLIALGSAISSFQKLRELAMAPTAPKPAELGKLIGEIFAANFWGLLATIIPITLSVFALLLSTTQKHESAAEIS